MREQYHLSIRLIKEVYNPLNRFGVEKYTTQIGITDRQCPNDIETIIDDGINFIHSIVYSRIYLGNISDYHLKFDSVAYDCELQTAIFELVALYTENECPLLAYHQSTNTLYYDFKGFKFKLYDFGKYNIADFMLEMNPGYSNHPDRIIRYIVNYIMAERENGYTITGLEGEEK